MTSDDDWPTNCLPRPNTPRPAKPTGIETIFAERATVELGISVSVISFSLYPFWPPAYCSEKLQKARIENLAPATPTHRVAAHSDVFCVTEI